MKVAFGFDETAMFLMSVLMRGSSDIRILHIAHVCICVLLVAHCILRVGLCCSGYFFLEKVTNRRVPIFSSSAPEPPPSPMSAAVRVDG